MRYHCVAHPLKAFTERATSIARSYISENAEGVCPHAFEEFVAIAKSKSQDIDGLAALRMGLRERFLQSTLGSPKRFALEFESALAEAYAVAWASEPLRD